MNILAAWEQGITGRGVTVVHVDNGIDKSHPDLWYNYDPKTSTDLSRPARNPCNSSSCSHGTEMAGEERQKKKFGGKKENNLKKNSL